MACCLGTLVVQVVFVRTTQQAVKHEPRPVLFPGSDRGDLQRAVQGADGL